MVSRSMMGPRASALVVALSLSCAAAPAFAQNSAAADARYRQGKELMKSGQFADACAKFEESQKLDAGGGTEVALGECYEGQKKFATAWSHYDQARIFARRAQKADKERELDARLAALAPKIPKLVVKVPADIAALAGLEIRQDGAVLGRGAWSTALPVDPGAHSIEAVATNKVKWSKVVTVPDTGTAELRVGPLLDAAKPTEGNPGADEPAIPVPPAGGPATAAPSNGQRYLGYVVGSVGLVAAVVGGVLASKGASDANGAKTDQATALGNRDACGLTTANRAFDSGKNLNTTGWILAGVGGAALVGGVILVLTAPSSAPAKAEASWRFVPQASPTHAGLDLLARW